ncbi:unnamed protein product, partial [Brachionus calyciflorus]
SEENSALRTNIEAVFLGNFIKPVSNALNLAEQIYNKWVLKEKYNLSFTGHSLGGWFASMQCFHLQYDKKIDNVQAVVFDSPGIKMNIDDFSTNLELLNSNFKKKNLNIITYLSELNLVNTCNSHCGKKCYVLTLNEKDSAKVSNAENSNLYGSFVACFLFTLEVHKLDKILEYFDSQTGKFKDPDSVNEVIDWPCLKKNIDNKALLKATTYWRESMAMKQNTLDFINNLINLFIYIIPKIRSSFDKMKTVFIVNDEKLKNFYEGHMKTKPLDHSNDILSGNQIDDILFDAYYSPFEPYDFMSRFLKLLVDTYTISERSNERKITLKYNRRLQFKGKDFNSIDDLKEVVFNMIVLEDVRYKLKKTGKGLLDQFICVDPNSKLRNFIIKRPTVIDQLYEESAKNDVLIIHGIPSIGKTEIIRYYASTQNLSYFILEAKTIQAFNSSLKNISNLLEVECNEENISDWYDKIFNKLRRYKALFIIENLSDKEPLVIEFLVYILRNNWSSNFKIFVINRTNKIKECLNLNQGEIVNDLKIQGLSFYEIKETFADNNLLKIGYTNEKIKEIITELGDGTFISAFNASKMLNFTLNDPNITSDEVLLYIKNHAINFIDQELYENIYNSLDQNYRMEYLKLISILDKKFISIGFLADLLRKYERKTVMNQLDLLADMGLIEIVNDGSGIRVDSLFRSDLRIFIKHKDHEIFKDETNILNENKNFIYELITNLIYGYKSECLFHIFSNWIYKNDYIEKNANLIEHLETIYNSKIDIPDQLNKFYFFECLSFSKIASNDFKMALDFYKKGIEILENIFNEQNFILANALYNLAILFDYNGYYEMSLLYHETCLKMRRELHENNDHSDIVISLVGTGCINQKLGFLSKAYEFKKQAFEMANRVEKQPSYLTAYTQLELGFVNFEMGKSQDFEELDNDSIRDRIHLFSDKLDLDITYLWACNAFSTIFNFHQAMESFWKGIYTKSKILRSLFLEKASYISFLNCEYFEALSYCDESIKCKNEVYPHQHPELAFSLAYKTQLLIKNRENHDKIRIFLIQATEIEKMFFDEKSLNRVKIKVYHAIADFYEYTKEFDKSISFRIKICSFYSLPGLDKNNKLELTKALNDLGLTLFNLGYLRYSEKYLRKAAEYIEKIEGSFKKGNLHSEIFYNYHKVVHVMEEKKKDSFYLKKMLDFQIFKDNNQKDISNSSEIFEINNLDYNLKRVDEYIRLNDSIASESFSNNKML